MSVLSPPKLIGGLAPISVWRWKLHFPRYRLVKVSWKSVQPFPRTVVSYFVADGKKQNKKLNGWNGLPAKVVNTESVNSFKNAYDRYCSKDMDDTSWSAASPSSYKYKYKYKYKYNLLDPAETLNYSPF